MVEQYIALYWRECLPEWGRDTATLAATGVDLTDLKRNHGINDNLEAFAIVTEAGLARGFSK
jgi:hypothetical protein